MPLQEKRVLRCVVILIFLLLKTSAKPVYTRIHKLSCNTQGIDNFPSACLYLLLAQIIVWCTDKIKGQKQWEGYLYISQRKTKANNHQCKVKASHRVK